MPDIGSFWPTIYSSYKIIGKYLTWLASSTTTAHHPQILLKPIDVYLMGRILECYSNPPLVIDLAADVTMGASTVLWTSQSHVYKIIIPQRSKTNGQWPVWNDLFDAACRELKLDLDCILSQFEDASDRNPILICLAVTAEEAVRIQETVRHWCERYPNAMFLLFPLGDIGNCPLLGELIKLCATDLSYRLCAVREISPYLAQSRLGLFAKIDNHYTDVISERIEQLFAGNFQFLALAEATSKLASQLRTTEQEVEKYKFLWKEAVREKEANEEQTTSGNRLVGDISEDLPGSQQSLADTMETEAFFQQESPDGIPAAKGTNCHLKKNESDDKDSQVNEQKNLKQVADTIQGKGHCLRAWEVLFQNRRKLF